MRYSSESSDGGLCACTFSPLPPICLLTILLARHTHTEQEEDFVKETIMARYLNSASTLLPLVVLVAAFGVCHADVRSGVDLKKYLKTEVPTKAVTDHQLSTVR